MKLIKLTLTNFKGIKSFEFEPGGENASVYGTNGSGKTSLFDALTWLLFDKGSDWKENFSPKMQDENGNEVHNINNRVDGTFQLDDGRLITFSKDQSENWVKKRGGVSESFAGNTTEYYIDGVPVKRGEYKDKLFDICPEGIGQMLMQPLYFLEILDWKSRRSILLEVCGDVTEFDVINSDEELNKITRFLLIPGTEGQFYSVEECAKVYDNKGRDIKRRLEEIPARIDEASRALTTDMADEDVLEGLLARLQKDLDEAIAEKAALKQNGAEAALRNQAAQIKAEIAEGYAAFMNKKNEDLAADREKLKELSEKWQEIVTQKNGIYININNAKNKKLLLTSQRKQLADEYSKVSEQVWQGDTVCPTCKRELPSEEIEAAREQFNAERSATLEQIRDRIEKTCSKSMIAELDTALTIDERSYDALNKEVEELNVQIRTLRDKMAPVEHAKYEDTEEYKEFTAKLAKIEEQIASGTTDVSDEEKEIQANIERFSADIKNVQKRIGAVRANEQQKKRIEELEAEEKNLQTALEDCEYCLYLCGKFVQRKVAMLDEKINAKFHNVSFKLFEQQINGGIKEVCEVMVPSDNGSLVSFSDTNDAARLNAGLDIIDTLSSFWGISMPVVVDNAESVVNLKEIAPQVIRLVVSGDDNTLRVEKEGR
ncbi:MAG: AAA family ATPase [Oscillospiraceae bacterium]|nr:AAA family ATPase [Oscillospiraceae bacterium]